MSNKSDEGRHFKEEERKQQEMLNMQMQMDAMNAMNAGGQQGAAPAGGEEGPQPVQAVAENGARAEQRSTGFRELGEALRSVERRQ